MKTDMNHDLLTPKIEKRKHMEYSDQTVKLIAVVIEYFIINTMEIVTRAFLQKGLKNLY